MTDSYRPTPLEFAAMMLPLAGVVLLACGSNPATEPEYDPDIPVAWASSVTNPWFPLVPGTVLRYESATEDGREEIVFEVLAETRTIMGVSARVVRDRVYLEGELIEDTDDWYAQDLAGNVWYLGEETEAFDDGEVDTSGSFEWGVDGALPGIIMWADPAAHLGEEYRQEYYEDEAEDWGKVLRVGESVSTAVGDFTSCIVTEDWNALDPGTREHKTYCPDIGFVLEIKVGSNERIDLVARVEG